MQCKIVVLGDGFVGKTSLIKQFVHGDAAFDKNYCQTIGLNFYSRDLEVSGRGEKEGDVKVRLQLWDIGGQSIGSKMIANYIFNANVVLLVYDGTSKSSFLHLTDWMTKVKECHKAYETLTPCVIAVVGNKCDLQQGHQHWEVDAHKNVAPFIKHEVGVDVGKVGQRHFLVSAKSGDNVPNLFYYMAELFVHGVQPSKATQNMLQPIAATITDYVRHDPSQPDAKETLGKKQCIIS